MKTVVADNEESLSFIHFLLRLGEIIFIEHK